MRSVLSNSISCIHHHTSTLSRKVLTAASQAFQDEIAACVGGRCSTSRSVLDQHGKDESYHAPKAPDMVVFPESTEEVSRVLAACHRERVPVIPFGAGTSVEGHILALRGGVCLDMTRMSRIIEVHEDDMDCRVEAGVTRSALNAHLRDLGLFFSVDPGADATLGGMAATRASGTNTVRYGTMRENVLGLTAVRANGTIMRTGRRVKKSSAGYDLTHLLVGSEGTLAVITELSVRLWGQPEAVAAAVCTFPSLDNLVTCATAVMQAGVPVARMEMLDEVTISAVNRHCGMTLAEAPTLMFEFHGSTAGVEEQSVAVSALAREEGGSDFEWASSPEERAHLWRARHQAYWASVAMRPGAQGFPTDVCVPVSRLSECVLRCKALVERKRMLSPLVGHVGDGNFHMMLIIDVNDADEVARATDVVDEMIQLAHSMGGTCTGEHGVGTGKLKHLHNEHGAAALDAMHVIKVAFDERNILNPGKLGSHPSDFLTAH